jgi:hypothetical protein
MTTTKNHAPKKQGQGEVTTTSSLGVVGTLIELAKTSKILQLGILAIMLAVAFAIYSAKEVSFFGIEITGSSKTPPPHIMHKESKDSTKQDTARSLP